MSISSPPPPAAPKKKGLGCLGCGCLVLIAIAVLIGVIFYFLYHQTVALTSRAPASVPVVAPTEDFYQGVRQKVSDFNHDVKNHQAATIQLSGDEINAILARDPYLTAHHVQLFVAMADDRASVQASIPTNALPLAQSAFPGRYVNFKSTFTISYNLSDKLVNFIFQSLQIDDKTIPDDELPAMQTLFTPVLNAQLQSNPDAKNLLDQTKSMRIENGNLVIETQ